jgi:hypothetical protein
MLNRLLQPDVFPIFCVFLVPLVVIVVGVIGGTIVKLTRIYVDYHLKMQMLDRGLGPMEIEQVLKARGSDLADGPGWKKSIPPQKSPTMMSGPR